MDDSMSSTNNMTQSLSSNCSEESGWTLYFEDFLANNNYDNMDNIQDDEQQEEHASFSKLCNSKLISKTRKIHAKNFVDEDLEDTASSPGHSPKVNNDLNHLYMKSKELDSQDVCQAYNSSHFKKEQTKNKCTSLSQGKGQASQHAGEGIDMGFLETQLRKKGLCLAPMSMLLNHIS